MYFQIFALIGRWVSGWYRQKPSVYLKSSDRHLAAYSVQVTRRASQGEILKESFSFKSQLILLVSGRGNAPEQDFFGLSNILSVLSVIPRSRVPC